MDRYWVAQILETLEAGGFQEFCLDFFKLYDSTLRRLTNFGGSNEGKTKSGVPDLLHVDSEGFQIAIECSTIKKYWNPPNSKILDEWKPIQDAIKCHASVNNLKKIILCSSRRITHQNIENTIKTYLKEKNIAVEIDIFSQDTFINEIAEKSFKYAHMLERYAYYKKPITNITCSSKYIYHELGYINHIVSRISDWFDMEDAFSDYSASLSQLTGDLATSINVEKKSICEVNNMLLANLKIQPNLIRKSSRQISKVKEIEIRIPFQQISTIVIFLFVSKDIAKYGIELKVHFSERSSIHLYKSIEQGIDSRPNFICLNLFNAAKFQSRTYIPILRLPDATQELLFVDMNTGKKDIALFNKPFTSLLFNYIDAQSKQIIPSNIGEINEFPEATCKRLNQDNLNSLFMFLWYPVASAFKLFKPNLSISFVNDSFHYPCLLYVNNEITTQDDINIVLHSFKSISKMLVEHEYLLLDILMESGYLDKLKRKFNLFDY